MNRMVFSTNSNETDRMVSIVAYIHSLVNEDHFTRNELEELHANCQNPIEKMDKGSISKNITYLKKYNYCAKDADEAWILSHKDRLHHFHIHDARDGSKDHLALGKGELDVKRYLALANSLTALWCWKRKPLPV